jgi:hypothetical protein
MTNERCGLLSKRWNCAAPKVQRCSNWRANSSSRDSLPGRLIGKCHRRCGARRTTRRPRGIEGIAGAGDIRGRNPWFARGARPGRAARWPRLSAAAALSRDGRGGPGDTGAAGDGRARGRHGGGVSRLHLAALKETSGGREWSRRKGRSFAPTNRTTGVNPAGGRPCLFLSPPHP